MRKIELSYIPAFWLSEKTFLPMGSDVEASGDFHRKAPGRKTNAA